MVVLSNPTGDGSLGFAGLVDASSFLRGTNPKSTDSSIALNDQDPTESEKEEEEYYNQYIRSGRKKTSTRNFKPGTEGGFYEMHDFTTDGETAQDDGSEHTTATTTTDMEASTDRDRELYGYGYKYGGHGRHGKGHKAGYGSHGRGRYGRRYGGGYYSNRGYGGGYGYNNGLNFFVGGDDFSNRGNIGDDNWRWADDNWRRYNNNGFYRNSIWV